MVIGAPAVFDGPVGADEPRVEQPGKPFAQLGFLVGILWSPVAFPRLDRRRVFGDVRTDPIPERGHLRLSGPIAAALTIRTPRRAAHGSTGRCPADGCW